MEEQSYDLVVVGAGSGGYAAARTARDLGASVALVDPGPLGGLCILRGCMPSKTLLASGDAAHEVREAAKLGVHAGAPVIDFRQIMERKRRIIAGFADYRIEGIKAFPLYEGRARFRSPTELQVGDDVLLHSRRFVIATGSVIAEPTVPGLKEAGYIDSDAALELDSLPASVIVLGGGYVAAELGQFLHRMGVATTFVLRAPHLLSGEDRDVGTALTAALREQGITIETDALLDHVERRPDGAKVVYFQQRGLRTSVAAPEILYTLGRAPNIAGLDLEKAHVAAHPRTGIEVDLTMRTSNPNIFAVGDVTGQYLLVHVAIYQGEIAARNALRDAHEKADYSVMKAHTVFSDPQVAVVGDTEKALTANGVDHLVATYPFNDHGKAISIGKTTGFVKMIAAPIDGRILGVAIVGADASDLIHEAIVALHFRATVFDFVKIPHLHPTMAEILTYPAEELVERITAARRDGAAAAATAPASTAAAAVS